MPADALETIAYEAAIRALDKQESVLHEIRARTGALLAASARRVHEDPAEVRRRLTFSLDRIWLENDRRLRPLMLAFRIGAAALCAELLSLVALVSDRLA